MWTRGKTLGKGSSGFVSLATSSSSLESSDDVNDPQLLDLPSIMAVKSAEFSCSQSLQKERELLHEFQDCPHILRCYGADATEEDGVILYNLMLEYASGGSLADYIYSSRNGFLIVDEVKQFTKSLILGLNYIHRKGFVHCDVKPDNILLVHEGKVVNPKISDFGLSRKVGNDRKRKKGFRGTPLYMAPESILYGDYGPGVDVWALGCTVIEMITGKPLWDFEEGIEICDLLVRICTEEVEFPRGLSDNAVDFLNKCLEKNPKKRWTTDMLLDHPFVLCSDDSSVFLVRTRSSVVCDQGSEINIGASFDISSVDIDLIKPRKLLMNFPSSIFNKKVAECRGSVLPSSGCEFRFGKKRKRLGQFDEKALQLYSAVY